MLCNLAIQYLLCVQFYIIVLKKFITFEGGEGCGKTTQIEMLSNYLHKKGIDHITTREPGGTAFGEKIRKLMLEQYELDDPILEYLLLTASRKYHLDKAILPALNQNKFVLCDRFIDSTLVYQCYVKGMDNNLFEKLNHLLLKDVQPEITFYLDIDPEVAQARLKRRGTNANFYDIKKLGFHKQLRKAFLDVASIHKGRVIVIDADNTKEETHQAIVRLLF